MRTKANAHHKLFWTFGLKPLSSSIFEFLVDEDWTSLHSKRFPPGEDSTVAQVTFSSERFDPDQNSHLLAFLEAVFLQSSAELSFTCHRSLCRFYNFLKFPQQNPKKSWGAAPFRFGGTSILLLRFQTFALRLRENEKRSLGRGCQRHNSVGIVEWMSKPTVETRAEKSKLRMKLWRMKAEVRMKVENSREQLRKLRKS